MTNGYRCRICNNEQDNSVIIVREMMFGFREEFPYFKCSACGCLQIAEIPEDLPKYYPANYYSYKENATNGWFGDLATYFLVNAYMLGLTILKHGPYLRYSWVPILNILRNLNKKASILDIGCGCGNLLQRMKNWGYSNLTGIDPFIEKDILYPSGVKILKRTVSEHKGKYDLVMLHHSFEHMPDHHAVFKALGELLNDNGLLLIRIPVADSYAFRKYQNNWFQIDAPRHFFLHTTSSLNYLAKKNGFKINDIIYDSTAEQIWVSESYCRGVSFIDKKMNTASYIKKCKKLANYLNEIKDGDQCCFILSKGV